MRRPTHALMMFVVLMTSACLERETDITVHEDGSMSVMLAADGDPQDLLEGYPLPTDAPWTGTDPASRLWLMPGERELIVEHAVEQDNGNQRVRVELTAEFASASELPIFAAAETDTYRQAGLETRTALVVEEKLGRRIYVFERIYVGRKPLYRNQQRFSEAAMKAVPQAVLAKLEANEPLTSTEWEGLAAAFGEIYRHGATTFVREALLPVYTRGDADLSVETAQGMLERVAEAVAASVDPLFFIEYQQRGGKGSDALAHVEEQARVTVRASLSTNLDGAGVAWETRNAVLLELESLLAGWDHTDDLRDESFKISVNMPGRIVGGDFQESEASTARWTFDGKQLLEGDRVLRVVSVVE